MREQRVVRARGRSNSRGERGGAGDAAESTTISCVPALMPATMTARTRYNDAEPFETLDGSIIRELVHPARHGNAAQSVAEATVPPGAMTRLHRHRTSEEIYHVTFGVGVALVGEQEIPVVVGDSVIIPPGTPHRIRNAGNVALRFLCCSSPAYADEDTEILGPD